MTGQPAAQVDLFFPVAFDTKTHFEALAFQAVHRLDFAVARFAGDLLFNVALMVKQDMLGQFVYLDPRRWRIAVEIVVFFKYFRVIGDDIIMAVETFFHRREPRMDGASHIGMTVLAGDGLMSRMQPMTEGDGLVRANSGGR